MVGFSGSFDFISGNVGHTSTYNAAGLGLSAAPESFRLPFMKNLNNGGSMNVGVTTWTSEPRKVGNLNLPGATQRYMNQMKYLGGY